MNYGQTVSIGKYEVKEFETEERCGEEAERLIRSKMRKGYVDDAGFDFSAYPRKLIERDWGMEYVPVDTLDADEIGKLAVHKETDMIRSDTVAYATAFARIKITGSVSSDLKTRAIEAIRRLTAIEGHSWTENEVRRKMIGDLRSFDHTTDDR